MSITVTCSCGKQFRVKDEHAGKRATCPVCNQPLSIPGRTITQSRAAQGPPPVGVGEKSAPVVGGRKMFSRKVALAIAGMGVLLVAVLIVMVALSGSRSPSEAVKATFLYANQGKYSDANKGLSSQLRAKQDKMGMTKELWDDVTRKGTITKVEILKEEIRGEGATVRFKIHYQDGKSLESEEELLREDGSWKITSDHYLLDAMEQIAPGPARVPAR